MSAREIAATVRDPELPMLTLEDLGVLREVSEQDGRVVVTLTPTYLGCPAIATMRADLRVALGRAGYEDVEVRMSLSPAWSSDWISDRGRAALERHGIAPPAADPPSGHGSSAPGTVALPVPVLRRHEQSEPACPQCGAAGTRVLSQFGTTACRSLHVCGSCGEPFDKFKEH